MNIQINGHRKSSDTRKAERFFSERSVPYHLRDVLEKPLSAGEIENICRSLDPEKLLDRTSKEYEKRGFAYMEFDILEEIAEDSRLLRTPIVRNGNRATAGYDPETWQSWIDESKG